MANNAYKPTKEQVEKVLHSNWMYVANANEKSPGSISSEVFGNLDFDRIEGAAFFGDNLDSVTGYAADEITRQLRELGVLLPLAKYIVKDEHTIGIAIGNNDMQVLAGNKDGHDWKNGSVNTIGSAIRAATLADFSRFRCRPPPGFQDGGAK